MCVSFQVMIIYFFSKALLFLIKPFVWIFGLFIWAIFAKTAILKKRLIVITFCLLYICSNGFIVGKFFNAYETNYPPKKQYDVGIVLGGFSYHNQRTNSISFNSSSDRLLQAVKLLKQGVIKKLLISGGNAFLVDNKVKEADLTKDYLRSLGIPDSLMLIENKSRNTIENLKFSMDLLAKKQAKEVLIISSAWHLPRVKIIFEKQIEKRAAYYPTDFIGKGQYKLGDYIMPDPVALANLHLLIKEWVGFLVDHLRA